MLAQSEIASAAPSPSLEPISAPSSSPCMEPEPEHERSVTESDRKQLHFAAAMARGAGEPAVSILEPLYIDCDYPTSRLFLPSNIEGGNGRAAVIASRGELLPRQAPAPSHSSGAVAAAGRTDVGAIVNLGGRGGETARVQAQLPHTRHTGDDGLRLPAGQRGGQGCEAEAEAEAEAKGCPRPPRLTIGQPQPAGAGAAAAAAAAAATATAVAPRDAQPTPTTAHSIGSQWVQTPRHGDPITPSSHLPPPAASSRPPAAAAAAAAAGGPDGYGGPERLGPAPTVASVCAQFGLEEASLREFSRSGAAAATTTTTTTTATTPPAAVAVCVGGGASCRRADGREVCGRYWSVDPDQEAWLLPEVRGQRLSCVGGCCCDHSGSPSALRLGAAVSA
jgi:hypothetical protein